MVDKKIGMTEKAFVYAIYPVTLQAGECSIYLCKVQRRPGYLFSRRIPSRRTKRNRGTPNQNTSPRQRLLTSTLLNFRPPPTFISKLSTTPHSCINSISWLNSLHLPCCPQILKLVNAMRNQHNLKTLLAVQLKIPDSKQRNK